MVPNGTLVLTHNEIYHVYTISIRDFLVLPIKNWKYNRSPDAIRCNEIATHIIRAKQPIITMFYLVQTERGYDMIDGIHRYNALKRIMDRPVDYIADSIEWLLSSMITMTIMVNATEGQCVDTFQTLNRTIPVPELYIRRDPTDVKREVVEGVVNKWYDAYQTHFSATKKPVRPNMNRDVFIEDVVTKLYEKYDTEDTELTIDDIDRRLIACNTITRMELEEEDTPPTAIEKCRRTGFWLFMKKAHEIVRDA
jgi:hypothetical protein